MRRYGPGVQKCPIAARRASEAYLVIMVHKYVPHRLIVHSFVPILRTSKFGITVVVDSASGFSEIRRKNSENARAHGIALDSE